MVATTKIPLMGFAAFQCRKGRLISLGAAASAITDRTDEIVVRAMFTKMISTDEARVLSDLFGSIKWEPDETCIIYFEQIGEEDREPFEHRAFAFSGEIPGGKTLVSLDDRGVVQLMGLIISDLHQIQRLQRQFFEPQKSNISGEPSS